MRKRPMKGLVDALRELGADVRCTARKDFSRWKFVRGGCAGAG